MKIFAWAILGVILICFSVFILERIKSENNKYNLLTTDTEILHNIYDDRQYTVYVKVDESFYNIKETAISDITKKEKYLGDEISREEAGQHVHYQWQYQRRPDNHPCISHSLPRALNIFLFKNHYNEPQ